MPSETNTIHTEFHFLYYTVSATECRQEVLQINVHTLNTTKGRVHIATVVDGGEEDAEEHDISKSNGWSDVAVISCFSNFTVINQAYNTCYRTETTMSLCAVRVTNKWAIHANISTYLQWCLFLPDAWIMHSNCTIATYFPILQSSKSPSTSSTHLHQL